MAQGVRCGQGSLPLPFPTAIRQALWPALRSSSAAGAALVPRRAQPRLHTGPGNRWKRAAAVHPQGGSHAAERRFKQALQKTSSQLRCPPHAGIKRVRGGARSRQKTRVWQPGGSERAGAGQGQRAIAGNGWRGVGGISRASGDRDALAPVHTARPWLQSCKHGAFAATWCSVLVRTCRTTEHPKLLRSSDGRSGWRADLPACQPLAAPVSI